MTKSTQEIARIIGQQLGGLNRLAIMIGAKNFVALSDVDHDQRGGLKFNIGRGADKAINTIMIKYTTKDLYNVEYWTVRGVKATLKAKSEDMYFDQIKGDIEQTTKFYLSLR